MSRSKRKPYTSITGCRSNKEDKKLANRYFRRYNKYALFSNKNLLYRLRECSDVYEFDSDGLDFYISERTDNNRFIEKIQRK